MNIQIPIQSKNDTFLRLDFQKAQDRWIHSLLIVGPSETRQLLNSVEGTADDDYPASPPVQDINLHELSGGEAILSVGMAGNGHWSTSYSIENFQQRPTIKADLACLLKNSAGPNRWLGSTYSLAQSVAATAISGGVRITLDDIDLDLIAIDDFASIELANGQIVITPNNFSEQKTVATRWLFAFSDGCNLG